MVEVSTATRQAEARKREAEEFYRQEQWVAASCAFGEASELARIGLAESPQLFASISKNLAAAALRSGDATRAELACSDALEIDPNDVKSLYRRGVARLELGKFEDAERDLSRVTRTAAQDSKSIQAAKEALKTLRSRKTEKVAPARCAALEEEMQPAILPKYLTVPRPQATKTKAPIGRGFLLDRARQVDSARRAARREKPKTLSASRAAVLDCSFAPELPLIEGDEAATQFFGGRIVATMPSTSAFILSDHRLQPAKSQNRLQVDAAAFEAAAAALSAQLEALREWRDRALAAENDDEVVDICDRAVAIAESATSLCKAAWEEDWGLEARKLSVACCIPASQVRARADAIAVIGARCCLLRGRGGRRGPVAVSSEENAKREHRNLRIEASAALSFCHRYQGSNHRGYESLARDAYFARASAAQQDDDLEQAFSDALKALSLDPWASDAVKMAEDLSKRLDIDVTLFGERKATFLEYRGDEKSEPLFAAVRPGQIVKSKIRPTANARAIESVLETRAIYAALDDIWAPAPLDFTKSAAVGDAPRGGQLHVLVFRNDGKWNGGVHLRLPRTCGSAALVTDAASILGILRHDCARSYSMYLRDGSDGAPVLPCLSQFTWIAVGDDFDASWDDEEKKKKKKRKGYRSPANPADVARAWRVPDPAIPRRHPHWIVSGRMRAVNDLKDALEDLSKGMAVVVRNAHLVTPGIEQFSTDVCRDADGCVRVDDAWYACEDDDDAARGVYGDTTTAIPSVVLGETACLRQTIERYICGEANFGNVTSTILRRSTRGDVFPVCFDEHAVILAQVTGRSRLVVFDPFYHPALYAYPTHHARRHFSRLEDLSTIGGDDHQSKIESFPLAADLRGLEVDLGPGDALCLPRGWWRQEQTVGEQASVVAEIKCARQTKLKQGKDELQGPDLSLASTMVERYVASKIGKRNVRDFIDALRADVVESGWQVWPGESAQKEKNQRVSASSADGDHKHLVSVIRMALGNLLGPDTVEFFVSTYLAAPRWAGLVQLDDALGDGEPHQEVAAKILRQKAAVALKTRVVERSGVRKEAPAAMEPPTSVVSTARATTKIVVEEDED